MNIDQLKSYAKWFASAFPKRMQILSQEIQEPKWEFDFSIQSLDFLGKWFYERIKSKSIEQIESLVKSWFFSNIKQEVHGIAPEVIFDQFNLWWKDKIKFNPRQAGKFAMEWFYQNFAPQDPKNKSETYLIFERQWIAIIKSSVSDPISIDVGMYLSRVFSMHMKAHYPHIKWHSSFGSLKYHHYYEGEKVNFDPISIVMQLSFDISQGKANASSLKNLLNSWIDAARLYNEQLPVINELGSAGIYVRSIWDFKYENNAFRRKSFSRAAPILCKHLKKQQDPYVLEAIATSLLEEELKNKMAAKAATEVLEKRKNGLTPRLKKTLTMLSMQEEALRT